MVAELDGVVVGYVFFAVGYSTDLAARAMWLHDIFVTPAARGRGVGYALMAAVAAATVSAGCVSLDWGVHSGNAGALEFYRRIGASGAEVRIMGLAGPRLQELAAAAR
jgi:GNAT superfamily N-acetyltransferase